MVHAFFDTIELFWLGQRDDSVEWIFWGFPHFYPSRGTAWGRVCQPGQYKHLSSLSLCLMLAAQSSREIPTPRPHVLVTFQPLGPVYWWHSLQSHLFWLMSGKLEITQHLSLSGTCYRENLYITLCHWNPPFLSSPWYSSLPDLSLATLLPMNTIFISH